MDDREKRILGEVNDSQREAILHEEGPLLVVAGAGSGKTRVITRRIAWLIRRGRPAESILAITFTNKAAGEMRRRVEEMVGEGRVFISTFHAMCARFLRISGESIGIDPRFTILDADDQKNLVAGILKDLNYDSTHYRPASVLSSISLMKNSLVGPEDAVSRASSYYDRAVAAVYGAYDEHLRLNDSLDFDDLLLKTLEMFTTREDVLSRYRERFRFILIDEYQDTNRIQYLLARALAGESRNICATGDPDQSIYRWRGADIRNIIDFERDFPGARVIKLEQNYRSTGNIIKAAAGVIRNNVMRKERDLWTEAPDGERIRVFLAGNESEEADEIVQEIRRLHAAGTAYSRIAVFYRINALSRALERSLRVFNVPYMIVGGVEFYQRKEVKDLLAMLRLVYNPRDSVSLYRVLNTPPRGIGLTTIKLLKRDARDRRRPAFEVLKDYAAQDALAARPAKGVRRFLSLVEAWQEEASGSVETLLKRIIDDVGYLPYLERFDADNAAERMENVSELVAAVAEYESFNPDADLGGFLEETALIQDADTLEDGVDSVTLMTLHSAKGLEFDAVFLVGVEEGLIPHARSLDDKEAEEEERRLMYVGITRARKRLFLSCSLLRSRFGATVHSTPSRFLDEIPAAVVERPRKAAGFSGTLRFQREGRTAGAFPGVEAAGGEGGSVLEYDGDVVPVFDCGDRVEHPYFGTGEVIAVSGAGLSARLKVHFARAGEKLLLLEHARLKKIL